MGFCPFLWRLKAGRAGFDLPSNLQVFLCQQLGKRVCPKKRLSFSRIFLNFDGNGTLWC
jgi:hypothetical protein